MAGQPSSLKLVWTAPALEDLDELAAWFALESPTAASDLVLRALAAVERLVRFPASGRWVPELSGRVHREVIVAPLRLIYRREKSSVLIVHVTRGEQRLRRRRLKRH